jgi:tetratricopeptide (TPR) repeat protein
MISLLVLAAAAAASPEEARFADCVATADADPAAAIEIADKWRLAGGGISARQCLGLAYAAQGRWASAAAAFEQAAREGEATRDVRTARLWVQSGNAALASGDAAKASAALDAAISGATLIGAEAGEAHLDRARAMVALSDTKRARADIDKALALVSQDPLAWLLSATLARRANDLDRAMNDISEAAKRSPDDASVALEAGNIAILAGSEAAARTAWEAAVTAAPSTAAGKAAAASLTQLGAAPAP